MRTVAAPTFTGAAEPSSAKRLVDRRVVNRRFVSRRLPGRLVRQLWSSPGSAGRASCCAVPQVAIQFSVCLSLRSGMTSTFL